MISSLVASRSSLALALLSAPANSQQFEFNGSVLDRPLDLAISRNGKSAVLVTGSIGGGSSGHVYIVPLDAPTQWMSYTVAADDKSEDLVAIAGNYCIVGSGSAGVVTTYQLDPPNQFTAAGDAADVVAIVDTSSTPSIPMGAAMGYTGGINVYKLSDATTIASAPYPYFGTGPGTALEISDSIAMTPTAVIGIRNRAFPTHPAPATGQDGAVGVAKIQNVLGNGATFSFSCAASGQGCSGTLSEELHDVTVTPDGQLGVVSGNGVFGVYDLQSITQEMAVVDHAQLPHMMPLRMPRRRSTIDSVEATNSRAVIIGKDLRNDQEPNESATSTATDTARWRVTLVDLENKTWSAYSDPTAGSATSRAVDVAITPNGKWAYISTRAGVLRADLTASVSNNPPQAYPLALDPAQFTASSPNMAILSDSIETTNTRAVAIGRSIGAPAPGARIAIITVTQSVGPAAVKYFDFPDVTPFFPAPASSARYWIPVDLSIDPEGSFAVVRMIDGLWYGGFGRVVVVSIHDGVVALDALTDPSQPNVELGASWGWDSVECTFGRAVTGGEFPPPLVNGRIQILGF